MLAKILAPSPEFATVVNYLIHGTSGTPSPDRVAWVMTQNLPADEPELAARIMQATAGLSSRTCNPAYHMTITWAEYEQPQPDQMQQIARQTLELAGLAEHQALIMGHDDTTNRHLHMLINRVHPDTGKAWKTSHDYARFDAIMRELAGAHGFEYAPAHRFNPDETFHKPKGPNSRAKRAARRGAKTDRPQWSKARIQAYREQLREHLDAATTLDDIAFLAAEDGLTLERKGSGYVIGDRTSYVKLSALRPDGGAKAFSRRPASVLTVPDLSMAHVFTVDAVDIAKALRAWGLADSSAVQTAIADAQLDRQRARDIKALRQDRLHATCLGRHDVLLTRPSKAGSSSLQLPSAGSQRHR